MFGRILRAGVAGLIVTAALLAVPTPAAATGTLQSTCLEASCVELGGAYISHFTGTGCTGTESYYTHYFSSDGIRRSWNGTGLAGTVLRTVTNKSWKGSDGTCHNDWPSGDTLSGFVSIYR